mmetsp:Transcript_7372/g.7229  ORF Transcript_7372/g.7229 Transcript_7372/m.7229 type:complete len:705 (-) Transcript_7372:36-2150(-)
MIDLPIIGTKGITDILIISAQASQLKPYLSQIQTNFPSIRILIAPSISPLNFVTISQLAKDLPRFSKPDTFTTNSNRNSCSQLNIKPIEKFTSSPLSAAVNQFFKKYGHESACEIVINSLKELAETGLIMHDAAWFTRALAQRHQFSVDRAADYINLAQRAGIIHVNERQFGNVKSIKFCSFKLESVSLESLLWVLRSLRIDEMMPTERAIQSRMKEAFDFKPSPSQWENLIDSCKMYSPNKHQHTKSAPSDKPEASFSLFARNLLSRDEKIPEFSLSEVIDPVTGVETYLIYPVGEEWESVDQLIKNGDKLRIKATKEWEAFVQYLESYFLGSQIDDNLAIPGGRYGCAQFLKLCASQTLKNCSLGRLSYMVQLAIDEDLLRYQKTLLVWTAAASNKSEEENMMKLRLVTKGILDLLKENRTGISLAQLPQNLKKKLNFSYDITELGFSKLKDLLLTMPEVEIELRGSNHPFATLKNPRKRRSDETELLVKEMDDILGDFKQGLPGNRVDKMLHAKLGHSINWTDYKCNNIYDFVQKRASGSFAVSGNGDSRTIISKKSISSDVDTRDSASSMEYFLSNPSDLFYIPDSQPKVINVSNLPPELQDNMQQQALEGHAEQQRKFIEELLYEDENISNTLHGVDPPHYRTDSVEYHWSPMFSSQMGETHKNKTLSQDFNGQLNEYTRKHHSSYEGFGFCPPPGFGQ